MKHSILKKLTSTLMAFAVVLASFSFKIEKHFCGSNLVDVSVVSKIKPCCSDVLKDDSLKSKAPSCCSNISIVFEGFDNYQNAFVTAFTSLAVVVAAPTIQIPVDFILESQKEFSYSKYDPPPLILDIQLRDQVFLI